MSNPWPIYDELIDLVPADARVEEILLGPRAFVRSDVGVGASMIYRDGPKLPIDERDMVGRPLRDAAALLKSWDFEAASIGLAAINSALNTPERLSDALKGSGSSIFKMKEEEIKRSKVATVGHFVDTDHLAESGDFIILERFPRGKDLPDSACEYILADRDMVFITATTLVNKTLPRLLELSANAYTLLVGPSAPFAPEVFAGKVQEIAGTLVLDADELRRMMTLGIAFMPSHEAFRMYNYVLERSEN